MALPLIPIILGAGTVVRMVTPKIAEKLIKSGAAKKASKAAVNKVKGTPTRLSSKDAEKIVARSKPFVQNKAGAARPVPKSKIQKKMDKAKTGNDVATQGSRSVATQGSRAVAKRPAGGVAKRPAGGATATAAGIASLVDSEKKADKPLSKLPTKTVATRKKPVPVDDTPRPKRKPAVPAAKKKGPVQGPKNKPLKALEGGVRYVDNPFGKGKIKMDTSQKGMFPDEMEFDYAGGRVGKGKKSPRKRIGRGCGAAIKGGGKVMR
jgi:hypothetical protein